MIRIGILGYGNLGKGIEASVIQNPDMELKYIFTRRDPLSLDFRSKTAQACHIDDIESKKDEIDVLILCGGSATDLPLQSPKMAEMFNIVDSFDTHAKIPQHFENVDSSAKKGKHTAIISVGWDPGLFSVMRLYSGAVLPAGKDYTFWGRGVSQGHSDAIRRIEGVIDAKQYTVPVEKAVQNVRDGKMPEFTTREKHTRECYVVAEEGADLARIESEIKNMPNYFADYDTTVHFVSLDTLKKEHSGIPHGGMVIRSGKTGLENENAHTIEFSLKLDSNPQFTSNVLTAYARAAYRMSKEGSFGCKTIFDIPPAYISPISGDELRINLL